MSDSSILRYGTRSDEVMKLQQNLTALGLYSGTISGHYGSITEAAVNEFPEDSLPGRLAQETLRVRKFLQPTWMPNMQFVGHSCNTATARTKHPILKATLM